MDGSERRRALLVSAVVVGAVAWPGLGLVLGHGSDSFPLSTYPMFSRDPGRTVEVPTVVAIDPAGEVHRLSPSQIAGTDQVIQAGVTVRQAIGAGPAAVAELCSDVAAGLADRDDAAVTVAVVVERHDSHAWAEGEDEPVERRTVGDCRVPP